MRWVTARLLAVALFGALLFVAASAGATFSGHNGLIAFGRVGHGGASIVAVDPSGRSEVTLATHALDPAWSPDGTRIAFERVSSGHLDVYIANADGTNQHHVNLPGTDEFDVSWSPDGRRLVFAQSTEDPGLFTLNTMSADGTGLRPLIKRWLDGSPGSPAWSPNGKWIAFLLDHSIYPGGQHGLTSTDIWLVHPDGTRAHRLTRTTVGEGRPSWSPDSTRLVYDRERTWSDEGSDHDLFVLSLRTGRTRDLLRAPADDRQPVWSPDGRMIAFTRLVDVGTGTSTIELVDANGRNVRPLIRRAGNVRGLAWQALP